MINYILLRSERRTTTTIYVSDGTVKVRAPLRIPKRDVDLFVAANEKWIMDRLSKSIKLKDQREAFTLDYGDIIILRGKKCLIDFREGSQVGCDGEVFYLPSGLKPDQIKSACVQIYRRLAKEYLSDQISFYAARMGVTPTVVKISNAKHRWGSCTSKGSINFPWRLMMADDSLIDYVVVHELAHLKEMNHSARFWAIVGHFIPDYNKRRSQLIELSERLSVEDWGD